MAATGAEVEKSGRGIGVGGENRLEGVSGYSVMFGEQVKIVVSDMKLVGEPHE